jgi:hypothetical protein
LNPINQGQTAPWCTVAEVTISNNIIRHSACGISINSGSPNVELPHDFTITNNLWEDINGAKWGGGDGIFLLLGATTNAHIEHNTVLQTGATLVLDNPPEPGLVMRNNLMMHNLYGVIGSGTGTGAAALARFSPGFLFDRNVLAMPTDPHVAASYPPDNFFPASLAAVGFMDPDNGNYRLSSSSPYHGQATDGTDIGCNFETLLMSVSSTPALLSELSNPMAAS